MLAKCKAYSLALMGVQLTQGRRFACTQSPYPGLWKAVALQATRWFNFFWGGIVSTKNNSTH